MKKLIFLITLFIVCAFSVAAQSACPIISVIGPDKLVKIDENMTFTAKIDGIGLEKIKFEWIFSNGTLISGQGTSAITLATTKDMQGQTITAFVKINELPVDCPNKFSGKGEVETLIRCGSPRIIEDYGKILWRDEKVKLDNIAIELKNDDNSMVYFIFWTNKKVTSKTIKTQLTKIETYLTNKHKITKSRIKLTVAQSNDYRQMVYLIPIVSNCNY